MIAMPLPIDHYRAEYAAAGDRLAGAAPSWLNAMRADALRRFESLGFPSLKDEDWKYTSVRPIAERAFTLVGEQCLGLVEEDLEQLIPHGLEGHRLVFVNGRHAPQLSCLGPPADGIEIRSLSTALSDQPDTVRDFLGRYADVGASGFAALNTALVEDGAWIHIQPGRLLERPVHLLFLATGRKDGAATLRNLLVLGAGAQATVVEHYASLGDAGYLSNAVTEVDLGDAAHLSHYRIQEESREAFHVATTAVHQGRDSHLASYSVALGARLSRSEVNVDLAGEGSECSLDGLYVLDGRQHADFHTRVDHRVPHGTSRELFKGILDGHARGVFNGKVYVHPDAQHTDAEQANHNLLLSPAAEADTKPQLEIFADDVKCGHGATVGRLDEDALFYLRSRGLDHAEARAMLTYGFAEEVLEPMRVPALRDYLAGKLRTRLFRPEGRKA